MPSVTENPSPGHPAPSRGVREKLERWNRQLHYLVGLFLLFFLWLFAASGLLLNHPTWNFAESWNNRRETNYVREIIAPGPTDQGDLAEAHSIMRQIGIEGEILWTVRRADPNVFEFQVRRPGHFYFLKADWKQGRVAVRQAEVNGWGVVKVLHAFTGVQTDDPRNTRDWVLTTLWVFAMDATAVGLIFMVLSSLYLWWRLPHTRLPGAVALGLGVLACGLFCFGLRWLY